jgi:hypothetical protein
VAPFERDEQTESKRKEKLAALQDLLDTVTCAEAERKEQKAIKKAMKKEKKRQKKKDKEKMGGHRNRPIKLEEDV